MAVFRVLSFANYDIDKIFSDLAFFMQDFFLKFLSEVVENTKTKNYHHYCPRSGSGPPSLMGHFAFFYCNNVYISKVVCYKGTFRVDACPLKSSCEGTPWLFLKICPIIKFGPEMPVLLIQGGHTSQGPFNMTEGTENSENIFPASETMY